ncbi:MAG: sigma-70 family RNA polymerase sigma factor, partial [Bacteroidetes bacterium]|nr:sigma-70 family RNA polymerase sigma factor [Bacteroidota bacterium]
CNQARIILKDFDLSRDIAQSTIFKVWKGRKLIKTDQNIYAYLIKSVRNNALNYLRASSKVAERENSYGGSTANTDIPDYFGQSELLASINKILDAEPEIRAQIFRMRKFEGLSTKEVADKLNINEKRVHYNIGVMMDIMRIKLKDYLPLLLVVLLNYL